jgi:hypothetical protein
MYVKALYDENKLNIFLLYVLVDCRIYRGICWNLVRGSVGDNKPWVSLG